MSRNQIVTREETLWHGWFSRAATRLGCPIFTYQDKYGNEIRVTGVSPDRSGTGYTFGDKQYVGEISGRCINSTYRPHPDFYRYWW